MFVFSSYYTPSQDNSIYSPSHTHTHTFFLTINWTQTFRPFNKEVKLFTQTLLLAVFKSLILSLLAKMIEYQPLHAIFHIIASGILIRANIVVVTLRCFLSSPQCLLISWYIALEWHGSKLMRRENKRMPEPELALNRNIIIKTFLTCISLIAVAFSK